MCDSTSASGTGRKHLQVKSYKWLVRKKGADDSLYSVQERLTYTAFDCNATKHQMPSIWEARVWKKNASPWQLWLRIEHFYSINK